MFFDTIENEFYSSFVLDDLSSRDVQASNPVRFCLNFVEIRRNYDDTGLTEHAVILIRYKARSGVQNDHVMTAKENLFVPVSPQGIKASETLNG